MDELLAQLKKYLGSVKPSMYAPLLPSYDLKELDDLAASGAFPSVSGFASSFLYAIYFNLARYLLTLALFKPLAMIAMRLQYSPYKRDPDIEAFLKPVGTKAKLPIARIREFCAKSGRNEIEVQQYAIKKRHNLLVDQKTTKFVEALWRLIFYAYFIYLGYRATFLPEMVPWLLDTKQNFIGWPHQPVTEAVHFYYQIELAAYLHQLMWTEVTRSDALEMIVHHLATIVLVSASYLTSFTRVGSSILLVHDISDIFLESAKVMNYTSKAKGHKWASPICDTLFILFAVSFFVTRLVIFPRYLVYSMTWEASEIMGNWPGHIVFYGLLGVLQCLHIFWFYLILRMVPKLISTGIQKDERSDDEDDADFIVGDDGKKAFGKSNANAKDE